jgi:hypothetical protein
MAITQLDRKTINHTASQHLAIDKDAESVWKPEFLQSVRRGDCYFIYYDRPDTRTRGDRLVGADPAELAEPFRFIEPYLLLGEQYAANQTALRRVVGFPSKAR